jgi:superoxide reductase
MSDVTASVQKADWKSEKHVPVIDSPETVKPDEAFHVKLTVGKEIPHPNTTEHHIRWISLYFQPEGDKFTYHVGRFDFSAHGEHVKGANEGSAYTEPAATTTLKLKASGTLQAVSYCNIPGLWESSKAIKVG